MLSEIISKVSKIWEEKVAFDEKITKVTATLWNADRYMFDIFLLKRWFFQWDTDQDAPYYGSWINIKERIYVEYAEWDFYAVFWHKDEDFVEWVKKTKNDLKWFKDIDPGLNEESIKDLATWKKQNSIDW